MHFQNWIAAVAVCALCVWAPTAAADTERPERLGLWAPHSADKLTMHLYHLDEALPRDERPDVEESAVPLPSLDDPGDLLAELGGDPMTITTTSDKPKAENAVPMAASTELRGQAVFVKDGRFGGGLQLTAGDSGITGHFKTGSPHDKLDRTIAFWFRPDQMPADEAVLFTYYAQERPPKGYEPFRGTVDIVLRANGDVVLRLPEQTDFVVPGVARQGDWTHVGLSFEGHRGMRLALHVNGEQVLRRFARMQQVWLLDTWRVGSDRRHQNGLIGTLDEVYMSRDHKLFYALDLDWVDATGALDRPVAQPYFRDAADQLLQVDFNRRFEPQLAPDGLTVAPLAPPQSDDLASILQPAEVEAMWRHWFPGGVDAQALRLAPGVPQFSLGGPDLLPADTGMLAFWFKPVSWDNFDRWHQFMGFSQPWFEMLRVTQGDSLALRVRLAGRVNNAVSEPLEIQPGAWTHLAICWRGDQLWTYVNGVRQGAWGAIQINRESWQAGQPMQLAFQSREDFPTVVDDLRVFRRPLSPAEMQNLLRLHHTRTPPEPLPNFDASLSWNGVVGRVTARLVPLMAEHDRLATGELTLTRTSDDTVLGRAVADFTPGEELVLTVETDPLDFGAYRIDVRGLAADGTQIGAYRETFERPVPPWWQNTLGITDQAPPDWSAMQVDAASRTIRVDRRDITMGPGGLPERIVAADGDVLAGPIAVESAAPLSATGDWQLVSANEVLVQTRGTLQGDGYTITVDCDAEYDGYMWYRLTITPDAGQTPQLGALRIRIPYRAEAAEMYHWWTGMHGFRNQRVVRIGAFPDSQGELFRSTQEDLIHPPRMAGNFMPYMMLTGDERGMAWFAENDQGWTPNDQPAIVVERAGETVNLLLNVISEAVTLDGPRTLQFGLQPIPLKTLNPGWRMTPWWGVIPDSFSGNDLKGDKSAMFNRHPVDFDWEAVDDRITGMDDSGGNTPKLLTDSANYVRKFRRDYGREPLEHERSVPALYHDLRRFGQFPEMVREWAPIWKGAADGKVYTDTFIDYQVWVWNEWVSRTFIEGVYMDDAFNVPIYDDYSSVTYRLPDGSVQPGFQWRGHRDAIKRMRNVMWANGKTPHMCVHGTHTYFVPFYSFFDVILDGEDFYAVPPRTRTFPEMWTMPRLRFMNAQKWGQTVTWLDWKSDGELPRQPQEPDWFFRHQRAFNAAMLLTDLIWARHDYQLHKQITQEFLLESQYRLDPATQFVPYWDLDGLAATEHPDIHVSAWRRDGRTLLVIGNLGSERVEATVRIDPAKLGFPGQTLAALDRRDPDPTLLTYFDRPAPEAAPTLDNDDLMGEGLDMQLDAPETRDERRVKDPDGAHTVVDGALVLPVRPWDYRLIEFLAPGTLPPAEETSVSR